TTAQYSVDEARTAMIAGHKSAEAAPCSPTAAEEVKETLAAARDAMIEAQSRSSFFHFIRVARSEPRRLNEQAIIPMHNPRTSSISMAAMPWPITSSVAVGTFLPARRRIFGIGLSRVMKSAVDTYVPPPLRGFSSAPKP